MPVRLAVTEGTVADSSQALPLIEGIAAECLLADKAYDTNEIIATVQALGIDPVIPLQSRLWSRSLKASPVMTLHGSGLMPPSPSRPVDGQGGTATGQPQQPA